MNLKKSVKNQLKWAKVINSQLTEEKNVIVYNDLKLMKMHSASLVIKDKKKQKKIIISKLTTLHPSAQQKSKSLTYLFDNSKDSSNSESSVFKSL